MVRDSYSPRFTSSPATALALLAALFAALVSCTESPAPLPDAKPADVVDATKDALEDATPDAPPDRVDAALDRADAAADTLDVDVDADADASAVDASADREVGFVFADLGPFVPDDAPPPGYDVNFDRSWDAHRLDVSFRLVDVSALYADAGPPDTGFPACTPGAIEACACSDGRSGYQTCEYDFTYSPCACADPPPVITTPRLVAPLSGMRVTSQRPTLRWMLPAGVTRARVELCADRPCTRMLAQQEVTGNSWRSPTRFDPGVMFWRVKGLDATGAEVWTSATWLFQVRRRDTEVDSTLGRIRDFNGDGYDDLALSQYSATRRSIDIHFGTPRGLTPEPLWTLTFSPRGGLDTFALAYTADFTGDGLTDVAVPWFSVDAGTLLYRVVAVDVYAGDRLAPLARRVSQVIVPLNGGYINTQVQASDVDADGTSELIVGGRSVHLGRTTGPSGAPSYLGEGYAFSLDQRWSPGVDFNGDGFADASLYGEDRETLYYGRGILAFDQFPQNFSIAPWPAGGGIRVHPQTHGDFNGDGFIDVASLGLERAPDGSLLHKIFNINGMFDRFVRNTPIMAEPSVRRRRDLIDLTILGKSGDIDGDGYADVAAIVPGDVEYSVLVFRGGRTGLSRVPWREISGWSVSVRSAGAAGDFNGDGQDELIAIERPRPTESLVYIFRGGDVSSAAPEIVLRCSDWNDWIVE
ncbi:MAG: FG-GAP repeat domain-containing protein [Phycisphaerales bacterium]